MKKLKNPYANNIEFGCFACSPNNDKGLQMEFYYDDEKNQVISLWEPKNEYHGYKGVIHGGIQATLIDEIGAWSVNIICKTGGVTKNLNLEYLKPVYSSKGNITIRSELLTVEKRIAEFKVGLFDGKNILCTEALVEYYIYPEAIARRNFGYMGFDEYFDC